MPDAAKRQATIDRKPFYRAIRYRQAKTQPRQVGRAIVEVEPVSRCGLT
jgi:hypothetical protein